MKEKALVVGCGHTLWEDLKQVDKSEYDVFAINIAAILYQDDIRNIVSYHQGLMMNLKEMRKHMHRNHIGVLGHSVRQGEGVDRVWGEYRGIGGSSGFLAANIALDMGYTSVVLAGVPMDEHGHFYDISTQPLNSKSFLYYWKEAKNDGRLDNVKSLSGNTKRILGGLDG